MPSQESDPEFPPLKRFSAGREYVCLTPWPSSLHSSEDEDEPPSARSIQHTQGHDAGEDPEIRKLEAEVGFMYLHEPALDQSDEPIPPPEKVRSKLPNFEACKPDTSCHNHKKPRTTGPIKCNGCKATVFTTSSMHKLPCQHWLCLECLQQAAKSPIEKLKDDTISATVQRLMKECRKEEVHAALAGSEISRALLIDSAHGLWNTARDHAALTCCGVNMELIENFLPCLDPAHARGLWLVDEYFKYIETDEVLYNCGWPDCGIFISPVAGWHNGMGEPRWHCVACGGNSQMASSQSDGSLCPAR